MMVPLSPDVDMPPAPRTLEATGLPFEIVLQLMTKTLHLSGELTGSELAARLGVLYSVIEPCLDLMKRDRQCEIVGGPIGPQNYTYRLTEAGHSRAALYIEHSAYVGKLPVPLPQYSAYMRLAGRRNALPIRSGTVRQAFSHLVLNDRVLDKLGPGVAARHSLFIYGPPGNGKTVIAQAIVNLLGGDIAVPHAVSVDTEIIRIFDPLVHEEVFSDDEPAGLIAPPDIADGRWVRCRRPVVTVGGELRLESLELGYNQTSRLYRAPLQAQANGGVFLIDDFGRQQISPRELLNRWIVPLESRIDHLVLQTGQKFEMPFETFVVFATNLNPLELLDESFLRRIRYKVYAESPTREEFIQIFGRCCLDRGLPFDRTVIENLIDHELAPRRIAIRGCHPRDLTEHALSLAEYTSAPRVLTAELLSAACATYFLSDDPADRR